MTFRTLGSNGSLTTAPCSERRESKRKRAKSSVERHLHRQWHSERQRYRIAQRTSMATAGRVRCAMRLRDTTVVRVAARCARLLRVSSSSTRVRTSCEKINRCCSGDPAVGEAIRMRRDISRWTAHDRARTTWSPWVGKRREGASPLCSTASPQSGDLGLRATQKCYLAQTLGAGRATVPQHAHEVSRK